MTTLIAAAVLFFAHAAPPQAVRQAEIRIARSSASKNGEIVTPAADGGLCLSTRPFTSTPQHCTYMNSGIGTYEPIVPIRTRAGTIYAAAWNGMGSGGVMSVLVLDRNGTLLRAINGERMLVGTVQGNLAVVTSHGYGASAPIGIDTYAYDGRHLSGPAAVAAPASYDQRDLDAQRISAADRCAMDACDAYLVQSVFRDATSGDVLLALKPGCGITTYVSLSGAAKLSPNDYIFIDGKTHRWWKTNRQTAQRDWADACG